MRVLRLLAVTLVLAGCNDSNHSRLEGVYSGVEEGRSGNLPLQPPSITPMAGAVASDGSGYFVSTGSPQSAFVVVRDLLHIGPDEVVVGSEKNGLNLIQANVRTIPTGYKFSFTEGFIDTSFTGIFSSDPVTNDPKSLAALAGSYQGTDMVQNTFATGALDASGGFQGMEGIGCDMKAQLTQVDGKNLYDVTFQYSGGANCNFTLNGVAWVGDADLSGQTSVKGTYLNLIAFDDPDEVGVGMTLKLQ